jgi:hypothetical protein
MAKAIPLRLTRAEQKLLRLLEGTLAVCPYVDAADHPLFASSSAANTSLPPSLRVKRANTQLRQLCSFLTSLIVSLDFGKGQELAETMDFAQYAETFRTLLEVGRRYKVLNPDKLRTQYMKLMYIAQDCMLPEISHHLGFTAVKPLRTVFTFLRAQRPGPPGGQIYLHGDGGNHSLAENITRRNRPRD